ncbi:MAG: class I SAM-dependent methyltransferase [Defluviitaleaceae bacterium]|nr:class I SAM-dependent methyltransferase [Defluviitaleaceae bacterium]
MHEYSKVDINNSQKEVFLEYEINTAKERVGRYKDVLDAYAKISNEEKRPIKILDIGGGGGHFSAALSQHLVEVEYEIFSIDTIEHESWSKFSEISFIKGSAFELNALFDKNSFDLVFANYVFHHLIQDSYRKTINGISFVMDSIKSILNDGGTVCVSEISYNIPKIENLSSFLIYRASIIKTPFLAMIFKKFGSKSAGVGVCFQPIKKWKYLLCKSGFRISQSHDISSRIVRIILREHVFNIVATKGQDK